MRTVGDKVPNRPVKMWQAISANVLVIIILWGLGVVYINRVVAHNNQLLCGIVVLVDNRNRTLPPTNDPDSNKYRTEFRKLREAYHCS